MTERVLYGGWVKNDDIPDKDDYFNVKQKAIQSKYRTNCDIAE